MASLAQIPWKPNRALYQQWIAFAFLFGVGFGLIAIAEHRFAVWQINDGEASDLKVTVDDVSSHLLENGHRALASYRQWNNDTPSSYFVLDDTGESIDVKGDPDPLLRSTLSPDRQISTKAALIRTDLGETWLLQDKRIENENVVAGIAAADLIGLQNPHTLLSRELDRFGTKATVANSLDPTIIRNVITGLAIVTPSGEVRSQGSGVPIRVRVVPDRLVDGRVQTFTSGEDTYSLLSQGVSGGSHAGHIVAFDLPSTEAIDQSLRFNLFVAAASWLLAFLGYTTLTLRRQFAQSRQQGSLDISTRQLIARERMRPSSLKKLCAGTCVQINGMMKWL